MPAVPAGETVRLDDLARALDGSDRTGIRSMLHPDVVLIIDSGGRMPESSTTVIGRAAASAGLAALMTTGTSIAMASINGVPGMVVMRQGATVAAVSVESRSGLLSSVWIVCNPDKLTHWNRPVGD
nr:hypothetical protein [Microbacterium hydrocarbonoxydans]